MTTLPAMCAYRCLCVCYWRRSRSRASAVIDARVLIAYCQRSPVVCAWWTFPLVKQRAGGSTRMCTQAAALAARRPKPTNKTHETLYASKAGIGHGAPAHRGGHVQTGAGNSAGETARLDHIVCSKYGRRPRQEAKVSPTQRLTEAGRCTKHMSHPGGTPLQGRQILQLWAPRGIPA